MRHQLRVSIRVIIILLDASLVFGASLSRPNLFIRELDGVHHKIMVGDEVRLNCTGYGNPPPFNLSWEKLDGKDLGDLNIKTHNETLNKNSHVYNTDIQIRMIIVNASLEHMGEYSCKIYNGVVERKLTAHLDVTDLGQTPEKETKGLPKIDKPGVVRHGATFGTVLTVAIITLLGVGLCTELHRRKNRHGLSKRDVDAFYKGNSEGIKKEGFAHEHAMYLPYDFSYELDEDKLKIRKGDILGKGTYGIVVRGNYNGSEIAVKTVNPGADKSYQKALLTELKIMIHIGRHPNIVELVGAISKDLRRGILNIVVKLYSNGNLENHLRGARYSFVNQIDPISGDIDFRKGTEVSNSLTSLNTEQLLKWSFQIAGGMEYLGSRNVIHGDLAARNILLDERMDSKITDFGLARQMYDYANYVKKNQEPLPWRWMSIESLSQLEFSPASDVWSFGILLWEMFSCGDVPYPGQSWTTDFLNKLNDGLRLSRPKYASKNLYRGLMVNCWQARPEDRISFSAIKTYFKTMLDSSPTT